MYVYTEVIRGGRGRQHTFVFGTSSSIKTSWYGTCHAEQIVIDALIPSGDYLLSLHHLASISHSVPVEFPLRNGSTREIFHYLKIQMWHSGKTGDAHFLNEKYYPDILFKQGLEHSQLAASMVFIPWLVLIRTIHPISRPCVFIRTLVQHCGSPPPCSKWWGCSCPRFIQVSSSLSGWVCVVRCSQWMEGSNSQKHP